MGSHGRAVAASLLLLLPTVASADPGPRVFRGLLARCSLGHHTTTTTVKYGDPALYQFGVYGWPGDYHDPRFPEPIPLAKTDAEKEREKKKPTDPSEQLPPPRRVGGPSSTAWLQQPR